MCKRCLQLNCQLGYHNWNALPDERGFYTYRTDCQWVIDTRHRPRAYATSGTAVHADLWRQLYHIVEDIGEGSIQLLKVKGHKCWKDCVTIPDCRDKVGNDHADKAAKRAAAEHPTDPESVKKMDNTSTIIQHVAAYLGSAWAWWVKNFGKQLGYAGDTDASEGAACNSSICVLCISGCTAS